jgi:secondary thiamine-phosphate synthase enzyme
MTIISRPQSTVIAREVPTSARSIAAQVELSVTVDVAEDIVDLTDALRRLVADSKVTEGTLHVYCGHTTCGLVANEDESGLDSDMKGVLERIAPHSDHQHYAHDKLRTAEERLVHGERDNGHSHARAIIATHPELHIPITGGELYLGRWQTIRLAEFDGPRTRELLARVHIS